MTHGSVRRAEITTAFLNMWLTREASSRRAQADLARSILRGAFDFAIDAGLLPTNPLPIRRRRGGRAKTSKAKTRVMTLEDLTRAREALHSMRQASYLPDAWEVQLALATRIGETLSLHRDDLEETEDGLVVWIRTHIITPLGERHRRVAYTKTGEDGVRPLLAPFWVEEILRVRATVAGDSGLLFVSRDGTLIDPHWARDSWRTIRKRVDLDWVKLHNLRAVALTAIIEEHGVEAAAAYGGNSPAVVRKHYDGRTQSVQDARAALESLSPGVQPAKLRGNRGAVRPDEPTQHPKR